MKQLGMNAIIAVNQGSAKKPFVVTLQWNGSSDKSDAPIAFVGKGVTFDAGGLNLKSSYYMKDMQRDMAGAGVVLGLMKAIALSRLPINVVGVIPLVENMISGEAIHPGDIIRTMSGMTVEISDTDAEGRLILADALWYTQDKYKPAAIVDIATLTGVTMMCFDSVFAGLFGNSAELVTQIYRSSKDTGEETWKLPMHKDFEERIKSNIADLTVYKSPGYGDNIFAAHFLKQFVNGVAWAHLDIAGVEMLSPSPRAFGIVLLYEFIKRLSARGGTRKVKFKIEKDA